MGLNGIEPGQLKIHRHDHINFATEELLRTTNEINIGDVRL